MAGGTLWTAAEDEIIRSHPDISGRDLVRLLARRTLHSVIMRRSILRRSENWDATERTPRQSQEADAGSAPLSTDELDARILSLVKKRSLTLSQLSDLVDRGPSAVREAVERLREKGMRVLIAENEDVLIPEPQPTGYVKIPVAHLLDGQWFRLGVVSDTHLCNRHARTDVLEHAYDAFAHEGIQMVLHGGNWVDGIMAGGKTRHELTHHTFHDQVKHFVETYPKRDGIETWLLSGDDHEGWHHQQGYDVPFYLRSMAREAGRDDLKDLGYGEVDIPFGRTGQATPAIIRVSHPKDGSAYALSYSPQRMVESLDGGETPQILMIGHYHKAGQFQWRNVHTLLMGCMERQTYFMRGKKLQAHIGYWVVEFQVHEDGSVPRFRAEWRSFFNEGYYRNRYNGYEDEVDVMAEWLAGEDSKDAA